MLQLLILATSLVSTASHPCEQLHTNTMDGYTPFSEDCCQHLVEYQESVTRFVNCSMWWAKPFKVCENCLDEFLLVQHAQISLDSDELKYYGKTCRDALLSSDRIHVIANLRELVQKIWSQSNCEDCYDMVNGSYVISEQTQSFLAMFKDVFNCFQNDDNEGDTVCVSCKAAYAGINEHYSSLGSPSGICMDIAEAMNITRQTWSLRYQCLQRYEDALPVSFIIAVLMLLPVLVYGGVAAIETQHMTKVYKQRVPPRMRAPSQDVFLPSTPPSAAAAANGGSLNLGHSRSFSRTVPLDSTIDESP